MWLWSAFVDRYIATDAIIDKEDPDYPVMKQRTLSLARRELKIITNSERILDEGLEKLKTELEEYYAKKARLLQQQTLFLEELRQLEANENNDLKDEKQKEAEIDMKEQLHRVLETDMTKLLERITTGIQNYQNQIHQIETKKQLFSKQREELETVMKNSALLNQTVEPNKGQVNDEEMAVFTNLEEQEDESDGEIFPPEKSKIDKKLRHEFLDDDPLAPLSDDEDFYSQFNVDSNNSNTITNNNNNHTLLSILYH